MCCFMGNRVDELQAKITSADRFQTMNYFKSCSDLTKHCMKLLTSGSEHCSFPVYYYIYIITVGVVSSSSAGSGECWYILIELSILTISRSASNSRLKYSIGQTPRHIK